MLFDTVAVMLVVVAAWSVGALGLGYATAAGGRRDGHPMGTRSTIR
jgi:hypothetical protein